MLNLYLKHRSIWIAGCLSGAAALAGCTSGSSGKGAGQVDGRAEASGGSGGTGASGGSSGAGGGSSAAGGGSSAAGGGSSAAGGGNASGGATSAADGAAAFAIPDGGLQLCETACNSGKTQCPLVDVGACIYSCEATPQHMGSQCRLAYWTLGTCVAGLPAQSFTCVANLAVPAAGSCVVEKQAFANCGR